MAYAFVQTQQSLRNAIQLVNEARSLSYASIIHTVAHRGWVALIFESGSVDNFLLRHLSEVAQTRAFGLSHPGIQLRYRLYHDGEIISAYESHMALQITDALRRLMVTNATHELDTTEPMTAWILHRYRQAQLQHNWEQPSPSDPIPQKLIDFYQPRVAALRPLLKSGVDEAFIAEVLQPGYSTDTVLERLFSAVTLPYLDETLITPHGKTLSGREIFNPVHWQEALPDGWGRIET
jgi:hypothetical protein